MTKRIFKGNMGKAVNEIKNFLPALNTTDQELVDIF